MNLADRRTKTGRLAVYPNTRESVSMHSDGYGRGEGHPAINVKYYGRIPDCDDLTDTEREQVWECCVEDFWEQARELAVNRGYAGVWAKGRSGGWLVPYLSTVKGYPGRTVYPDPDNFGERAQYLAFERDIRELMEGVPALLQDQVEWLRECKGEEASRVALNTH